MPTEQKPSKPPARSLVWWWLALSTLLVWNAFVFWPRGSPEAPLPYSAFVAEVRADRVARVEIEGDRLTGSFTKPVRWPAPGMPAPENSGPPPEPRDYTRFRTTLPVAVGDPKLMGLLETHHVIVDAKPSTAPWFVEVLSSWGPLLLLVGLFWWMGRQASRQQAGLFGFARSRARRYTTERPQVTFEDVAGADEAKADLEEEVDFLRHPQKYHDLGARIPRGVLLVGPPGTGKTLLARAVAGEAGVPFFSLSASEFVEMFVGVGASRVRDLFTQAKAAAPAIVFIDELDAVGRRRGAGVGAVNDEREQTLNQLLVEMDGFDERENVIVLAATNRPDVLDPALLRPGRFDRRVEVGLPDRRGREGILRIHTRKLPLAADVDLGVLARSTTGLSGADIASLCNEATLIAARKNRSQVTMGDFIEAQDKVLLGGVRGVVLDARERRVVAYHEAGHAVVAWLTPAADPVRRVTIVPHGRALGVTQQLPGEDRYNYSRTYLLAKVGVMLGGRAAEEIALGELTTGAENDLVEATQLARRMVTRWGMGALGPVAFSADDRQPFLGYDLSHGRDYSEATAARVDQDVQRVLAERHEHVRRLLTAARERLEGLVETLLAEDTVGEDRLATILGPRPAGGEAVPPKTPTRAAG
ncbi:MAG TPA: ATP-dependent zinc metalloprotease FtsH [Candidatus Binatia bacterium]|nr:ATP-dependent zinc metalloprotease FtsH [Candidatus Binatia bacterium]